MASKVLVLGGGLVGAPMAMDLAKDNDIQVAVADLDRDKLSHIDDQRITKIQADLSVEEELKALVADFDLLVNAVPGFMGFKTLRHCIEAGKDVVDIAFYPEDVFSLSELAEEKGVRVIADMGVAPGMSNLLAGYAASRMQEVENIEIYVGGLPRIRRKPWEFKVVFSPTDVIEEYTRPARLVEYGEIVTRPALSEVEHLEFEGLGTLEAFNSDGLRSLMFTLKAKQMKEKTLRYPGYAEKVRLLAENGFFSQETVEIDGQLVRPLDVSSKLLFDAWKLGEDETDITVMRIIVEGKEGETKKRYVYDLYDERDPETGVHSMARTTGYAATMATRLLLGNFYRKPGVTVPEMLGENEQHVLFMLQGLKDRNVIYREKIEELRS
jgi:saccharopine dehydrogenase-like NADP-dependent oxidoreductase